MDESIDCDKYMYLKIFLFVIKDKINKTQMEKYEKLIQLDNL